jgi:beta-lactam-binding protein with PASTA domain
MNRTLSRLVALVFVLIFVTAIVIVMMLPSSPQSYELSYDNKEGVITATLEEPLPSGKWTCEILYEKETADYTKTVVIAEDANVNPSVDRTVLRITTDPNVLINLSNGSYDLYLKSSGQDTIHMAMDVNDHEMTDDETLGMWLAIGLMVVLLVFVIVRRIVRGH